MKRRVWVNVAIAVSAVAGLLGLLVGGLNIFTHWCGEDCGSTASRVSWGLAQVVAALLLLAGAYFAAKGNPNARWIWIAAVVASLLVYFWAWVIIVPVAVVIALGIYALWPTSKPVT
jgi:hypothetical protein